MTLGEPNPDPRLPQLAETWYLGLYRQTPGPRGSLATVVTLGLLAHAWQGINAVYLERRYAIERA